MKSITTYQTEDGHRYDSEARARKHEELTEAVRRVFQPLEVQKPGDFSFTSGSGYYQHAPSTVRMVKRSLIELTRPHLREWMDRQEIEYGYNLMDVHPSWFSRMLDGGCPPLEKGWGRLWCFTDDGREYGQPYYANNPGACKNVCLNP